MKTKIRLTAALLAILLVSTVQAANKTWVGTDDGNEGDLSVAENWSPNSLPTHGDAVYFEDSTQDADSGLDALSDVNLLSLNIAQNYTGDIGTDSNYMVAGANTVSIGYHFGPGEASGSGYIKLDTGTYESAIVVYDTGVSSDTTMPAVRLKCNNANTTLEVRKGEVGLAIETGETSTLSEIEIGYVDNVESDAKVYIGSGVTLTTLTKKGGYCLMQCGATTVNNYDGELQTKGGGAVTTLNIYDGQVISNSTGTITTCNIDEQGEVDFTRSAQARTVTTTTIDDNGVIKFDPAVITFTNKIISSKPVTLRASPVN